MVTKSKTMSPKSAAIISFFLALPITILFLIIALEIEPFLRFITPILTTEGSKPNTLGFVVLIGSMLLLPVAFVINLIPTLQKIQAGKKLRMHPINLLLAVVIIILIGMTWGRVIDNKVPCVSGVTGCN